MTNPFKPLVVGAPRSGFALLASVVIHFVPLAPGKLDLKQHLVNTRLRELGDHIAHKALTLEGDAVWSI